MPTLRIARIVLIISLACAPVIAQAQGAAPRYGGSIVVAISSDPGGLNPAITTQGGVTTICGSIFSGLVAHDFSLNPVPDLAESWEVSPDGRAYTFHLAPGAVFHDGAPVTSEDVRFTFEELLLKYHSRTRASLGDNLIRIETPDAHTVVFEFKRPYAAFLQLVDVTNAPVMPKHLYEGTDPLTNPHNTAPVGSGAFKFGEWLKGDHLTLVRNENYFQKGKPYLDRILYKVMPAASMAAIAFEGGEVDYLTGAAPLDLVRLKNASGVVVTDKGREGFATVETLIPNLTRAPLSDPRVRQAMAHAIDKSYIVDKVASGMGAPATGPVSSSLAWAYNPNVVRYEHDAALADRLLDEAGYGRDRRGVRFRLKFVHAASYAKVAEALRDQLREVGIAVDLNTMEFAAAVDAVYVKKDFDLAFASFENGPDPDIGVKRTLVSSNIGAIPFSNGAGYRDARVDELFALAASETDRQKRAALYFEAQDIVVRDLPYFWLYEPRSGVAYKKGLRGMYEWSAKSSVYFARDAWWADGGRHQHGAAGATARRGLYLLIALAVLASLGVTAVLLNRRRRRA
ncbi:MAG: ABC transporter substrate-binding protein [Acidobacteria bacterium]|nr:ABC transporter substrate-binding protein [Acidobacteriota bacterium]MCA1632479.1 ABC transporter substrate-binding protein [Acidobacteriota bacterium]MCA1640832.1 ABC transporter substrate-binding protein [Acidobacteriota bacterium]